MLKNTKTQQRYTSIESNEPIHFEDMQIKTTSYDSVKREMYRDNYRVRKALKKYGIETKRIH